MIVNLIGPPGAGKSKFASRFVLEHPYWKFCPIDTYRLVSENDDEAWKRLKQDVINHSSVLVESVGVGERYRQFVITERELKTRPMLTIRFDVKELPVLMERINARAKRTPGYKYDERDEQDMAVYVHEEQNSGRTYPLPNIDVWTDVASPDVVYETLSQAITQFRVANSRSSK